MKRILIGGDCTAGVEKAFRDLGFAVQRVRENLNTLSAERQHKILEEFCSGGEPEYFFSFDFHPDLAEICHEMHVIYISWIWDCPHVSLWAREARYETNRIYVFDYRQYLQQAERGLTNVFYLPLASDYALFDAVIARDSGRGREKYGSEVTFLGNLYNDGKHNLYDRINYLPPYTRGFLEGVMSAQKNIWGLDLFRETMRKDIWDSLKQYVKWDLNGRYEPGYYEEVMCNLLYQKTAQLERMELCSLLAGKFDFTLYTDCDTSFDPGIRNMGHADYETEMPLIFHYSKINVNITLRSITSGIPLRVMDVLACGGFLLTNYQPEIAEYFEDGKELVIYHDFYDLCEKAAYYLEHDEEREKIAVEGRRKVTSEFTYYGQLQKLAGTLPE